MKLFDKIWHDLLKRPYKLVKTIDTGQGQVILLIHGLGTSGKTWEPFVKLTDKKNFRIIGFDLLGFGKSPKPENNGYSVNDHAQAILASLDKNIKKQQLIVVGHSMGSLIASHIAWLNPSMIKQLILFEPPLFADSPEFRSHKRRKKLYFTLYQQILRRPRVLLAYSKAAAKFKLNQGRAIDVSSASWTSFERSLQNTIMKQQAYNELKKVKVPTDIIYGKFDFIVTRADVKKMLQANKYINFHLVNEMHDVTPRASKYIIKLLNTS